MNVLRAIQIFSPSVTASLKFLKEAGDPRFCNVDATISYLENMYKFFQIHNVSSRTYYIRSRDSTVAPYADVSDQRLEWLNVTLPNYIDDVQSNSSRDRLSGLSGETAEALKFTAKSTCLCIKFLLKQVGFYYVLTRGFSSDAVEAMFSHVRLRGGSNDATDARAAEYALRQILRCGIVKASTSANISETMSFVSTAPSKTREVVEQHIEDMVLPFQLRMKIQNLKTNMPANNTIYSASVAFLAGYIIKKLNDKLKCDVCVSPLVSTTLPGPLLRLIFLQDRGGLTYPNETIVGIIKRIADIVQEISPFLKYEMPLYQAFQCLYPHLKENSLFCCPLHKDKLSSMVINLTVKPVLDNICLEKTDMVKNLQLRQKPLSRKVLKL
ncbi:hypothetical protein Zmor_017939 [Zophobas morio]|uniref:Transposable element P transposase-like GTP-binding insertion domain-containing protein n=1 Tax=Zophobas morio TaxID=2755281 RepID=A0AA38MCM8_9CUCU|nr:hypothetical protein Zmor_017939 [Zophobas morio]